MKTAAVLAAFMAVSSLHAATVDEVIVRQQWPWSTDVKVEYRISGVTDPVNISVAAYDGDTPLDSSKLAASMKGDLFGIARDCYGSFTIDVTNAFGTASLAIMNFNVRLSLTPSSANMADVLYKVVDLDSGAVTDITRADFYGNKYGSFETNFTAIASDFTTSLKDVLIWTEVTNNPIYKTDKLVMRKIPAASWGTWPMFGGSNGASNPSALSSTPQSVRLTEDYYIGVFPVTQAQCKKIWGTWGVCFTNGTDYADHLYKPATGLQWWKVRSLSTCVDALSAAPESGSFLGLLNARVGTLAFDLPTEAQWEFAARGGTTNNTLYSGAAWTAGAIYTLAWNSGNVLSSTTALSGNAGYDTDQPVVVGRKPPNAFGLYDTLGNTFEYCLDYSSDQALSFSSSPAENPKGVGRDSAATGTGSNSSYKKHISRGGAYASDRTYCTLRSRFSFHENQQEKGCGFRVICTVK